MRVFLTGGAGYIGSHTLTELLGDGHDVCVYDNFANSRPAALARVRTLSNRDFEVVEGDIRQGDRLAGVMRAFQPDAVIHFAGLKAVGESAAFPLEYYENNVQGSITLLRAMDAAGCRRIVFSSSATVYGEPRQARLDESHPLAPTNPYGRTKRFIEEIIGDWAGANADASAVLLRYFNPAGAHETGRIGEDPRGTPNNLAPFVSQVAAGRRDRLKIFGGDYPTRDGTGERDFVHVIDLARAHIAAIDYAMANRGCEAINVGAGSGVTVLEMVRAFERATGRAIPYDIVDRRPGDVPASVADPARAQALLGWTARFGLDDICRSAWNWQSLNPDGYEGVDPEADGKP
ncbi:MAG: UDP-glucose 4-epimerase GalE [Caulobacter sp.]|nr:UDP-glucose 4-epimerase GalE [Caulobacter sp.]